MARSKKSTTSQQIVNFAASSLPQPIRNIIGSRWGARLTLLALAALIGSGVVTVQWSGGIPQINVNRERAREVKDNLVEQVEAVKEARDRNVGTDHPWDPGEKLDIPGVVRRITGHDAADDPRESPPIHPDRSRTR
jgi:hypothetical protein